MKHYNIKIIGTVQNVSFKSNLKKGAQNHKVNGFARNLRDGSVYAEIEADENILYKFIDWCHIGIPRSKVESVEIEPGNLKYFENFQIKN